MKATIYHNPNCGTSRKTLEILREAAAPPPRKRRPTKPTRGSKERRLAEKKRRGQTKQGRSGRWD